MRPIYLSCEVTPSSFSNRLFTHNVNARPLRLSSFSTHTAPLPLGNVKTSLTPFRFRSAQTLPAPRKFFPMCAEETGCKCNVSRISLLIAPSTSFRETSSEPHDPWRTPPWGWSPFGQCQPYELRGNSDAFLQTTSVFGGPNPPSPPGPLILTRVTRGTKIGGKGVKDACQGDLVMKWIGKKPITKGREVESSM